ncbi:PPE domain-containing protein, partial [Mycobacterium nebraskense]
MPETLKVEYEELMARANEIEAALPPIPATNPAGPCALSFVTDAATQLALSADSMRLYLRACEREWKALAKSLRNAAKAYEEVDEESAEAISAVNGGSSASGVTPGSGNGNDQMAVNGDPYEDFGGYLPPPPPPLPSLEYPYYEVREAATAIESGDQGTAFKAFAKEWDAFQREFQKETYRFRPFSSWEGESCAAVEQNFELHRQWIYSMAQLCVTLGNQALRVVDAHKKARVMGDRQTHDYDGKWTVEAEHPTSYEVAQCDYWYNRYVTSYPYYLYMAVSWYESLQQKSETSLNTYIANASLPLSPVNPKTPPSATRISAPPDPNSPEDGTFDPNIPGGWPTGDGSGAPATPMMPTLPMTPGAGMPGTADQAAVDAAMKDASKGKPGLPGGGGLKPAGLGGGGAGVPSMPLQPAVDAEAASRP